MANSAFIRFVRTGKAIPLKIATGTADGRQRYLKPFTGSATVECLCADPPIPMTVAHRRVGTETWYLCPASSTEKHRHAEWCPLHIDNTGTEHPDNLDAPPAITVEDTRTIIRGGFPETWQEVKPGVASKNAEYSEKGHSSAAPRKNLTSTLWALWSQSELNIWKPAFAGKRFYGSLRGRLLYGAQKLHWKTVIGKHAQCLTD